MDQDTSIIHNLAFLVYSKEHRGFWKKPTLGYTESINEAGRFTYEEAKQIVQHANRHLLEDGSWEEIMTLAPENIF